MSPLKAIERANLVMFRVIQEIPSGDLHDQLREAIVLDLRSAPPSADRRPELPLGRASTGEREGTLVARFGRRGR
jgi:hypothetical protein